ncbi:GGDEF domain-containing protein [Erythrobacter sp. MTPC3]|uniref:GGDEF domain-containing protein n=1 Tax=Erythrobacter sp. MTPC3 TaxID=3056564 RepID=UPI0036F19BB3
MKMGLNDVEGRALHGLVEEASGDIVIRLDPQGFLVYASENISEIGRDLTGMLVMPHISDLAQSEHGEEVADFVGRILSGQTTRGWCEFPVVLRPADGGVAGSLKTETAHCSGPLPRPDVRPEDRLRWYALSLKAVTGEGGTITGAVGLLRSVQHKRTLEGELHSRAVTDPLTGLANRHAFCASLRRHLAAGGGQYLVIMAVDGMRALFMQYGQRTADEIMWGFAKFLETMALPGHEIAQLDSERFAVILPDMTAEAAREWAEDVLQTFSALALPTSARGPRLSASAGMAATECTVDWTLRQAELALVMARAGGGKQVGQCGYAVASLPVAANMTGPDRAFGVAGLPR